MTNSAWMLVASNIFTIALAIFQQWEIGYIVMSYWIQSVIIGIFQFVKILDLKEFDTTGFTINDRPAPPTTGTKYHTAFFFLMHYGFFHFIYAFFLVASAFDNLDTYPWGYIAMVTLLFVANHLYSFLTNRAHDRSIKRNIGHMMFIPYTRIIPMHITLVFAGSMSNYIQSQSAQQLILAFFLGLKTVADLIMHLYEHSAKKSTIPHNK